MKTKIAYIVVSDNNDFYLQQAILSIYSLRIYNPDTEVIVVVDQFTNKTLVDERSIIKRLVDHIVVVSCPDDYSKQQRSRQLKTTLREHIQGDYLFIDTDTIISSSLEIVDNIDCLIGAVKDKHLTLIHHPMYKMIRNWATIVGWNIKDDSTNYYNSGVFFVKDVPMTHLFYKRWNEEWTASMKKGLNLDQPSLGKVDSEMSLIKELNGIWNCQITDNGLRFLNTSKVIHYFASTQKWDTPEEIPYYFRSYEILKELQDNGNIITDKIREQILNAKSAFKDKCIIQTGRNIELQETILFKGLKKLYFQYPKLYKFINRIISFIIRAGE